jgi:hypothetical protein
MTKNKIKVLVVSSFLVIVVCCTQTQQPGSNSNNTSNTTVSKVGATATPAPCNADPQWVNNPQSGPSEIPGGGTNLCQFHQFSWQWFLALMNTATPTGAIRNYQNQQNYPQLEAAGTDSCASTTNVKTRLFVRTRKDNDRKDDFILPERIGQAGGDATIYDQNGNVVFYEVRFSRNMCSLGAAAQMFPAGTIETKISYRVITEADAPYYVTIKANVIGDPQEETLGMVGFHLAISTQSHPEFIWATFEHKQNVPECQTAADPNQKWSFTSGPCAAQLPNSVNPQLCNFNMASPGTIISGGTPTQICRVYHAGSKPGDNQYDSNVADIDMLNRQLAGPSGYLTSLSEGPLAVLQNYQLVGGLWVHDPTKPTTLDNQRGSIQSANTTMETTHQQQPDPNPGGKPEDGHPFPYTGTGNLRPAANCFTCHTYQPGNNVALSHIFTNIKGPQKPN